MKNSIINALKSKELVYQDYGITYLGLFGSQARGDNTDSSDVDILIDYSKPISFFQLSDLKNILESLLSKKVDLVTKNGLKKSITDFVYKDLISIYEKA